MSPPRPRRRWQGQGGGLSASLGPDAAHGPAPGQQGDSRADWWVAVAALAVTLLAAVIQDWQATDIVWGMWISSLVTGYLMILVIIAGDAWRGRNPAERGDAPAGPAKRLAGALWMVAFFSFHFLFFHAGHAMFTQQFFPLAGVDTGAHELVDNFLAVTPLALSAYWPMVLASFAASGDAFRNALAGRALNAMAVPYRAVAKNHVMIFIVIGFTLAGLQGWLLYPLFIWYFVPATVWRPLLAKARARPSPMQDG